MTWQSALTVGGLCLALAGGWFAGRHGGRSTEPTFASSVQLDARAMQLLLRNDSGSAASAPEPAGHARLTETASTAHAPEREYFPQAVSSQKVDELRADQDAIWDKSLAHLPPESVHEIQTLKTRLGSVAAASLGLEQLQPTGAEPAVLQLPQDGSLKAAPLAGPVTQVAATSVQQPAKLAESQVESHESRASRLDLPLDLWRSLEIHNARHRRTPGFKRSFLLPQRHSNDTVWEQRLDLRVGELEVTANPFDLAIDGQGWFVVQQDDRAQRLTRCGLLSLDDQSRLGIKVGQSHLPLIPVMVLPPKSQRLEIAADGICRVWCAGHAEPQALGRLQLANCLNPSHLRCGDDGAYSATDSSGEIWTGAPGERGLGVVRQGHLERAVRDTLEVIE